MQGQGSIQRELVWVADNSASPSYYYEQTAAIPKTASHVFSVHVKEICIAGIQTPNQSTHFSLKVENVTGMTNTTISNVNSLTDKFVMTVHPGQSNVQNIWSDPQLVMRGKGIGLEKLKVILASEDRCAWSKAVIKFSVVYGDDVAYDTNLIKKGIFTGGMF